MVRVEVRGLARGLARCLARGGAHRAAPRSERGAAAVEFALASGVLCLLLIGGMEVGRALWAWQAAAEATRLGARLAAVCGLQAAPHVTARMQALWPGLDPATVVLRGLAGPGSGAQATPSSGAGGGGGGGSTGAATCDTLDCVAVQVALEGAAHRAVLPWAPGVWRMPAMTTTLRREAMDPTDNAVCQP
jgi:Flp pilus assembly pilin Flp